MYWNGNASGRVAMGVLSLLPSVCFVVINWTETTGVWGGFPKISWLLVCKYHGANKKMVPLSLQTTSCLFPCNVCYYRFCLNALG
jgi:hypothetical protein